MGTTTLKWRRRGAYVTEQRIYRATESFDESNLPTVLATVGPEIEEYVDETPVAGTIYYYRVASYWSNPEWLALGDLITIDTSKALGPGTATPIGTTPDGLMSFYGEVPASEFITGDELAQKMWLGAGVSINSDDPWLKFQLDGKILFVHKKGIRNNLSWDIINNVDLVYGNRTITLDGYEFRVRLLKGADTDPYVGTSSGNDLAGTQNSEWSRLFYPIVSENVPSYTDPKIATYNPLDLNMGGSGDGRASWCQEVYGGNTGARVRRGDIGVSYLGVTTSSSIGTAYGFRPALELIV